MTMCVNGTMHVAVPPWRPGYMSILAEGMKMGRTGLWNTRLVAALSTGDGANCRSRVNVTPYSYRASRSSHRPKLGISRHKAGRSAGQRGDHLN